MSSSPPAWREGGCHCRAVRFAVAMSDGAEVHDCNCSICAKTGFLHLIVPESRFRLNRGAEALASYRFNTGVAEHLFCKVCGVKSFYRPRSNPDGWSVNARCLDAFGDVSLTVVPFDGANWEDNGGALAALTKEAS